MKNLPDKIYLNFNMTPQEVVETKDKDFHEATKTWEITWSEEPLSEHDPEYIRKDALMYGTNSIKNTIMLVLKELAWKVPLFLLWSQCTWFAKYEKPFWICCVIAFVFFIMLDLIRWGLKKKEIEL